MGFSEDHSSGETSERSPNFTLSASVFAVSLVAAILPKVLSKSRIVKKYFGYMTVFTAGLQLSTILVDLIPHMASGLHDHHHEHKASDFYPHIASGLCFLFLLGIDSIFLHNDGHKEDSCSHKAAERSHHHEHSIRETEHNCSHETSQGCHDTVGTCNTSAISTSKTKIEGILFLLAISIHSFFEGLTVTADLKHLPLITGLFFHKILESFAIGVSVFDSIFSQSAKYLFLVIYSLLTPLAILFKDIELFANSSLMREWFTALCTGSLMFVVFFEMIGHSFHGGKNMISKMWIIIIGYLLGCTSIVLAHAESH